MYDRFFVYFGDQQLELIVHHLIYFTVSDSLDLLLALE